MALTKHISPTEASPQDPKSLNTIIETWFDRSKKSIQDFLQAWIESQDRRISGYNYIPRKKMLMDIYELIMLDGHLSNEIEIRKSKILGEQFMVQGPDGKIDEKKTMMLMKSWFRDNDNGFVSLTLDAKFFGYSLIGLNNLNDDGFIRKVTLVQRRNVIPEHNIVLKRPYDLTGIDLTDPFYANDYLLVNARDQGLLLKAAPLIITKKDAKTFWIEHAENFALDMLVGKTDTNDPAAVSAMQNSLKNAGREKMVIIDYSAEVEPKEVSRSDVYQIYKEYADAQDREISKLIKGHTSESGNYSEAGLNKLEGDEKAEADMEFIEGIVNDYLFKMLPKISSKYAGFDNCTFAYAVKEKMPMLDRRDNLRVLKELGYEADTEAIKNYLNLPFEIQEAEFTALDFQPGGADDEGE